AVIEEAKSIGHTRQRLDFIEELLTVLARRRLTLDVGEGGAVPFAIGEIVAGTLAEDGQADQKQAAAQHGRQHLQQSIANLQRRDHGLPALTRWQSPAPAPRRSDPEPGCERDRSAATPPGWWRRDGPRRNRRRAR